MATIAREPAPDRMPRPFIPRHPRDRNAVLVLLALVWAGILLGFGGDIADHVASHKPPYPPIVHVHAVAFLGWLVLFTVQAGLIRFRRFETHRRLGYAMLALAAFMIFIGPATALYVDRLHQGTPDADPTFVYVQLTDILSFAVLGGAGVIWRKRPAAHKRLMLLSLLYISDAGFARVLGPLVGPAIADPYWSNFLGAYLGPDVLVVALGLYDLATRRRLHPAYLAGAAWIAAIELGAIWAYLAPAMRPFALALIG
jgi:hypothetical protein